jgi:hypothetical protein
MPDSPINGGVNVSSGNSIGSAFSTPSHGIPATQNSSDGMIPMRLYMLRTRDWAYLFCGPIKRQDVSKSRGIALRQQ